MINIARYIDHTILKPTTTHIEISKICREALEYGFAAVCIPPPFVREAVRLVKGGAGTDVDTGVDVRGNTGAGADEDTGTDAGGDTGAGEPRRVKVATVIGFPFGYSVVKAKLAEVEQAIADGADELDIVINLVALKSGEWALLEEEMGLLANRAHADGRMVKVIIESGILTDEEIIRCCGIYSKAGVDFLKTSTGYAEKGATIEAVRLMRRHLPLGVRIKASGGIREYDFARQLIEAGADRLGCSASVEIVKGQKN